MNNVLVIVLIVLGFAGGVFYLTSMMSSTGKAGEDYVAKILAYLPDEYFIINNVVLERNGYTNQIDHVVVSPYGIFCIETKNMKGIITGSEYSQYWTQNIWGNKYELYNPILQNGKHVKALRKELAKFGDIEIFPITVFTRRCELKVKKSNDVSLVYTSKLLDEIESFKEKVIPDDKVETIADFISISEGFQYIKENDHISNARQAKRISIEKTNSMICPRCGGQIVVRNGKYGKFLGCSNYPNCRYTENRNS